MHATFANSSCRLPLRNQPALARARAAARVHVRLSVLAQMQVWDRTH